MRRALLSLLASSHPGPTTVVTTVSVGLAISAGLPPATSALIAATIVANQLSIGWSNDAIDAARDREAGRADKPVARGDVTPRTLGVAAGASALSAIALSLALGPGPAIAQFLLLASGWAYNLGLKRTVAATACYAVGFGALPSVITLASAQPAVAAWWVTIAGSLLGVAAHFSNVVPDLDDDRRHQMRALPHRVLPRTSVSIALGALLAASALSLGGSLSVGPASTLTVVGAVITAGCVAGGTVLLVRNPTSPLLFRLVMAAALGAVTILFGSPSLGS